MRRLPLLLPFLLCLSLVGASCGALEVASSSSSTTSAPADGEVSTDGDGDDDTPAETNPLPDEATVDTEPAWATLAIELEPIAEIENPIALTGRSGSLNLYVATRDGTIRVIERTVSPTELIERIRLSSRPMLDLTGQVSLDGEQGLLNLTFSTDGRLLYVYYTDPNGDVVVAQYDVDRAERADVDSRVELLRIPQPAANHNGGGMAIGPDGFLYLGLGDGGGAGDPLDTGQDPSDLLGSLLRIDPVPDGTRNYTVPVGNPFAAGGGAPEVWLYGVRNPWRFSFDASTGDLWLADVGQDLFEEMNVLGAATDNGYGANLGWNEVEGLVPFDGGTVPAGHTSPAWVYAHENGRCSITGGHTSRNDFIPLLDGVHIFGDYCSGEIFGMTLVDGAPLVRSLQVTAASGELVSFGQDTEGAVYVVESGGRISRISPKPAEG